jgi:DNA primase
LALDLSKVDVYEFLNELGMNNVRDERGDVWYSCFSDQHYRGDANPSASMEQGTTRFHCFSCGMSGNAVSFLAELENVSPIQAAVWIKERFVGADTTPERSNILNNVKEILNQKPAVKKPEINPEINEVECIKRKIDWKSEDAWLQYSGDIRSEIDIPVEYMLNRGFTLDVLNKFEIGWDKISERISIPIRNENGKLVGFKARALDGFPKYIVLGGPEYGFETYQTKKVLFGLDKADVGGELIVLEGELNVIAMHQHGFSNSVGISGKVLSDEQAELIKKNGQKVILIFDEYEDAYKNSLKLRRSVPTSIVEAHDKDPADMDWTELKWLLQSASSSLLKL